MHVAVNGVFPSDTLGLTLEAFHEALDVLDDGLECQELMLSSVLLYVQLKNENFPSPFFFPYTKVPLSPQCHYLSGQFLNCMQKVVKSARCSWDIGFKKPRTIVLTI